MTILDTVSSVEAKVDTFQALIEQLPTLHQYLLLYLLDILCLFSLYSENTRMDLSSLATAFAPVSPFLIYLFILTHHFIYLGHTFGSK